MKRDVSGFATGTAAVLISVCIAGATGYAQIGDISKPGYGTPVKPPPPMPKPTPTPRTRDGHPDLSGVWFIGTSGTVDLTAAADISQRRFDPKVTPQEPPSFQPWVALKVKRIGPQDQSEPCLTCEPLGVPGFVIKNPYPIQIIQTEKQIIMLAELDATWRTIWIDGRPHPKDPDPKFNGDSVGHWEGDTLVVDTIAVDTHIFRVANRIGLAHGKTPLAVESQLEKVIPKHYIKNAHHWLILHGRYVCKARKPDCGQCVIEKWCEYTNKTEF